LFFHPHRSTAPLSLPSPLLLSPSSTMPESHKSLRKKVSTKNNKDSKKTKSKDKEKKKEEEKNKSGGDETEDHLDDNQNLIQLTPKAGTPAPLHSVKRKDAKSKATGSDPAP
ncbi:hypothetical protein PFISCL1PPCAC_2456, partial [Pristionchus fissidentatus]